LDKDRINLLKKFEIAEIKYHKSVFPFKDILEMLKKM